MHRVVSHSSCSCLCKQKTHYYFCAHYTSNPAFTIVDGRGRETNVIAVFHTHDARLCISKVRAIEGNERLQVDCVAVKLYDVSSS